MSVIKKTSVRFFSLGVLLMFFLSGCKDPPELGLENGRLKACPDKPNCVCSFDSDEEHAIAPMDIQKPVAVVKPLVEAEIKTLPGVRLVQDEENYLRFEFTSKVLRFVDDFEVFIDGSSQKLHFRSASRLGHSDLGVNRKRVELIRGLLKDKI